MSTRRSRHSLPIAYRLASALVLCLLPAGACSDGGTGPDDPDPDGPVLRGTVHAVGGDPVEGLRAVWRTDGGGSADSARVGSDGTFEIRASGPGGDGELLVDGSAPRTFHPFLHPFRADEVDGVDLLMVPRAWTIGSGAHEGETVPTPLDPAVEDEADQLLYSYFFGQPEPRNAPERILLDLMMWPADHLPARVAIDHAASTAELTPADSAAIWAVFDQMEATVGLDLFEPVEAAPGWWSDPDGPGDQPFEAGVVRLVHDPPHWRGLFQSDEEARVMERELGAWASDGRFTAYRERHTRLNGGLLVVGALEPLRLADGMIPWQTVLIHETLHVLGLGHTCRIPSPMGPCMRTPGVSEHDVAYMELLRETLRQARELDAVHGIMPAVVGERRILLGTSALPPLEG